MSTRRAGAGAVDASAAVCVGEHAVLGGAPGRCSAARGLGARGGAAGWSVAGGRGPGFAVAAGGAAVGGGRRRRAVGGSGGGVRRAVGGGGVRCAVGGVRRAV